VTAAFEIRLARVDEAEALSALCRRSKAHWGYDAEFMRLSEPSLTIAPASIEKRRVVVAEPADRHLLGVASIEPMQREGDFDLAHLFVEPEALGLGIGRALFEAAVVCAKAEGARRLVILSDPNAAAFYERMGAVLEGDAPSDAIPGRRLPLLYLDLA
jgi:GNAT superfamily N-acetyltransferase